MLLEPLLGRLNSNARSLLDGDCPGGVTLPSRQQVQAFMCRHRIVRVLIVDEDVDSARKVSVRVHIDCKVAVQITRLVELKEFVVVHVGSSVQNGSIRSLDRALDDVTLGQLSEVLTDLNLIARVKCL